MSFGEAELFSVIGSSMPLSSIAMPASCLICDSRSVIACNRKLRRKNTLIHKDGVMRVTESTLAPSSALDESKITVWMTVWGRAGAGCHAGNLFSVLRSRMTMQRFFEQESVSQDDEMSQPSARPHLPNLFFL
jgi:hypothetical protein